MNLRDYRSTPYSWHYCLGILVAYVEPNPITYCRLSRVSRDFHIAFTSDSAWQYLNPYGWASNIYCQFIGSCKSEHPLVVKFWTDKRNAHNLRSKRALEAAGVPADSAYLQLGFLIYTILGPNIEGEFQDNYSINSRDLLWCAVHICAHAFDLAGSSDDLDLTNDREIVKCAVESTGDVFWNISAELQNDREIVWRAIQHRIVMRFPGIWESVDPALALVPENFKQDRDIVTIAVSYNREAIQYASPELRDDKQVVLTAIAADRAIPTEVEDGRFLPIVHPQNTPLILQWVSERLRDDRDVVLAAVRQDGMELMHASERLKNSLEIVIAAVNRSQDAYYHSSPQMQALSEVTQAFHAHGRR